MRRIDRYLLKEMLTPALIGGVLVLMLLVGNWLYGLLKLLYTGSSGRDILLILALRLPGVIMMAVPASLLLGTALALNRLERDRELMSLRMTGVRLLRLVAPFILMGVLFSIGLFILQEKIVPSTTHKAVKLTQKLAYATPAAFVPHDVVFRVGQQFIYVKRVDPITKTLYNVIVCKLEPQRVTWLRAPVAEYHGGKWIVKSDPYTHKKPEFDTFTENSNLIIHGEVEGGGYLDLTDDFMAYITDQPSTADELTLAQLQDMVDGLRGGFGMGLSLTPSELTFQLHRKVAAPLAALVAVLIAIPLAVHFGRSGGYTGLLLSVVVAFCFVVSQQWAQVLAETHRLHPIFAAWAPDGIFGLLGLGLLLREE
ncbi:MAG: LptF/LptG family permease [Armatimonadota bacterium]